jgi:Domain of unknown function (DUF4112)
VGVVTPPPRSAFASIIAIANVEAAMATNPAWDYRWETRDLNREQRLARLDALSKLFDTALIIPGTHIRFGLDALIGLVPGIGDLITTATSLYLVYEARQLGAPKHLILRMIGNMALDGMVGAIPLVGDAFDVMFRSNRRNMTLLRNHLDRRAPTGRR